MLSKLIQHYLRHFLLQKIHYVKLEIHYLHFEIHQKHIDQGLKQHSQHQLSHHQKPQQFHHQVMKQQLLLIHLLDLEEQLKHQQQHNHPQLIEQHQLPLNHMKLNNPTNFYLLHLVQLVQRLLSHLLMNLRNHEQNNHLGQDDSQLTKLHKHLIQVLQYVLVLLFTF